MTLSKITIGSEKGTQLNDTMKSDVQQNHNWKHDKGQNVTQQDDNQKKDIQQKGIHYNGKQNNYYHPNGSEKNDINLNKNWKENN